jgi:anti-sigma B factor antagonist
MGPAVFEGETVDDAVEVVAITGELDISNSAELRRRVEIALSSGRNCVVIDLSALTYTDSSGLAALIGIQQLTLERGGRLALAIGSGSVRRTLEVRGLDRMFTVYSSREEALKAVCD